MEKGKKKKMQKGKKESSLRELSCFPKDCFHCEAAMMRAMGIPIKRPSSMREPVGPSCLG